MKKAYQIHKEMQERFEKKRQAVEERLKEAHEDFDKYSTRKHMSKWISISAKMPPDLQDVIVSDGIFVVTGYFMGFMEMWHIYGNSIPQHKEAYTYWQPLPEPPERSKTIG